MKNLNIISPNVTTRLNFSSPNYKIKDFNCCFVLPDSLLPLSFICNLNERSEAWMRGGRNKKMITPGCQKWSPVRRRDL